MNRFKTKYINYLLIFFLLSINLISYTFGKYATTLNKQVTLNIGASSYMIVFHSNNGLLKAYIPSTLKTINEYVFYGMPNFELIYFNGVQTSEDANVPSWNKISIESGNDYFTLTKKVFYASVVPSINATNFWYDDTTTISGVTILTVWPGNFEYVLSANEEEYYIRNIGSIDQQTKELVIPAFYSGKPVTKILEGAFKDNRVVTTIVFES